MNLKPRINIYKEQKSQTQQIETSLTKKNKFCELSISKPFLWLKVIYDFN